MSRRTTKETGPSPVQEIITTQRHPLGRIIHTANLYGKGVGRFVGPLERARSWTSDPIFDQYNNILNGRGDGTESGQKIRKQIANDMHYNLTETTARVKNHGRAVSTFYSIDEKNNQLIIEWGKIDEKTGEGKLHDSLRRSINYFERANLGMKIISGHIAPIDQSGRYFALMDSFSHMEHAPQQFTPTELILIDSLHSHGFLPLTTNGRLLGTSLALGYY